MAYKYNPLSGVFDIDTNTGGGGGAPTTATYLTLSLDATLSAERVLTAGDGITFNDTGANGTLTISQTVPLQESQTRHYVMALMGG